MSFRLAALVLIGTVCGSGLAVAQESSAPGRVEITYMPAGAGFVASKGDSAQLRQLRIWHERYAQREPLHQAPR